MESDERREWMGKERGPVWKGWERIERRKEMGEMWNKEKQWGKSEREWLREKQNKDLRKRGEIREERKENAEKLRGWKAKKGRE